MKIALKKLEAGRYAVMANGTATDLIVEKGPAPKYREGQSWCIGRIAPASSGVPTFTDYMVADQRSMEDARRTIATIFASLIAHKGNAP